MEALRLTFDNLTVIVVCFTSPDHQELSSMHQRRLRKELQLLCRSLAQKFVGESDPVAKSCIEELKCAKSPEEVARIGRRIQRQQPNL
ncbi:hypothetical protein H5410_012971, partial [Solanum commersonii]